MDAGAKRVLVTGGSGFIGTRLVAALLEAVISHPVIPVLGNLLLPVFTHFSLQFTHNWG